MNLTLTAMIYLFGAVATGIYVHSRRDREWRPVFTRYSPTFTREGVYLLVGLLWPVIAAGAAVDAVKLARKRRR